MKNNYYIIGVMSGTSLDGIDLALCNFIKQKNNWKFNIIAANTFPYTNKWKDMLKNSTNLSSLEFIKLHSQYGFLLGNTINKFININNITHKIDFISSHGHTTFHQPDKYINFQIGNGAMIAAKTKIPVICDFRTLDIALGGQGAPLVPTGDKILFNNYDICLNIGGFANISYDDNNNNRIAYDICPANIILNYLANKFGKDYDKNGNIGKKGNVNLDLLRKLNNITYYKKNPPKSLGKEWLYKYFIPIVENYNISDIDKLRTIYEHITIQIANNINILNKKTLLITGGGVLNIFLQNLLKNNIKSKITIPEKNIINFKEALIFAFLGLLRALNEINCYKSVTGAELDNIGGTIYYIK